jgi:hypothetical protein
VFLEAITTQFITTAAAFSDTSLTATSDICLHSTLVLLIAKYKVVPVHVMKFGGGLVASIHLLTSALDGGE